MSKKPKQHPSKKQIGARGISNKLFQIPDDGLSTDHLPPVFSFVDTCPNHFQLHEWQGEELKHLINTLRDLSKRTWAEVRQIKGFLKVDPSTFSKSLPEYLSPDITIYECRVSKRSRIFGHRVRNAFHIIWFDRNHEVYPMS